MIAQTFREACDVAESFGERLAAEGVSTEVVSLHTVKPLDERWLSGAAARFKVIVTVEEHGIIGGLGGCVAEWLADHPHPSVRLIRIGTSDTFLCGAESQRGAREHFGLTAANIAGRTLDALNAPVVR